MSEEVREKLLSVTAEAFRAADAREMLENAGQDRVFERFCSEILRVYRDAFTRICAGWISVAGHQPGFITAVACYPEEFIASVPPLEKKIAREIATSGLELIPRPFPHPHLRTFPLNTAQALAIRLIGNEEYYGLLVLCTEYPGYFDARVIHQIRNSIQLLNRLMAEANFSMRLNRLAAPFEFAEEPVGEKSIYVQIVQQACRGFAADGAVLRIRRAADAEQGGPHLDVRAHEGLVSEDQFLPGGLAERVCRVVFESDQLLTLQTLHSDGSRTEIGARISDEDDAALRRLGIQAYMIIRLQSDLVGDGPSNALGTLAVFHRLPQLFSRRDVNLFRSFCERVADDLALLDQRDANAEISRLLQAQNVLGTRAEIIALLGHDFGHRVLHVTSGLEDFVDTCTRNWKDRVLPEPVRAEADALMRVCNDLAEIVRQIRQLGYGADEPPSTFDVARVFAEIQQRFELVLSRNGMSLDAKHEGNCTLYGMRGILLQALFNLVINSVDAHKASGSRRKQNVVHLTCREVGRDSHRRLEFNVWDEGPGISRVVFPNPQQIFEIGTTSKPRGQGTGVGLPAARRLLGTYFRADLQLVDPKQALFRFSVPAPEDGK